MDTRRELMRRIDAEIEIDGHDVHMMMKDIEEVSTFVKQLIMDVKIILNNKIFNTGGKRDLKIKKIYSLALFYFAYKDMVKDIEEMNVHKYDNENEYLKMCNSVRDFNTETVIDMFYHYLYGFSSGDITDFIQKVTMSTEVFKNEIQLIYSKAKFKNF